jgi:ankyrin repeat protein
MQFMCDVEAAQASVEEDRVRILAEVAGQPGGLQAVNRAVRGAVVGALVASRCPELTEAVLGSPGSFDVVLKTVASAAHAAVANELLAAAATAAAAGGYTTQLSQLREAAEAGGFGPIGAFAVTDHNGMTPLHHASLAGHGAAVALILSHFDALSGGASYWAAARAKVLGPDDAGATPLMYAAEGGFVDIAEVLLAEGCDYSACNRGGVNALGLAAQAGATEVATLLLDAGVEVDGRDSIGYTPLRHAAYFGRSEVMSLLLSRGADANSRDNWSATVLQWAVDCETAPGRSAETVSLLLNHGAHPNLCDFKYGSAALDKALALAARAEAAASEAAKAAKATTSNSDSEALEHSSSQAEEMLAARLRTVEVLHKAGALTIAEQFAKHELQSLKGARFEGLLEGDIGLAATVLRLSSNQMEAAGLALAVCWGRVDWIAERSPLPRPGDRVSADARQRGWSGGLVTRGPDWPENAPAGYGELGIIVGFDAINGLVEVDWPAAGLHSSDDSASADKGANASLKKAPAKPETRAKYFAGGTPPGSLRPAFEVSYAACPYFS